jgi:hypothetical protein
MWPRQRASQGIDLGTIASLTGAEHRSDAAFNQINPSNHMILRISHVQMVIRPCQAFRACQRRHDGLTTITRVPLFPSSSHMMNREGLGVDAVNRVALSERQIQVADSVESDCPGAIERHSFERSAVWSRLPFPGACERRNCARRQVYLPNAVIPDVANEKMSPAWIHGNTVRLAQLCAGCGTAVSGESWVARPRKCGHDTRFRVNPSNHMIITFSDVQVSRGIELNFVWHVQRRISGRGSITRVRSLSVTSNRCRAMCSQIKPSDALIIQVAEVQSAAWSDYETVGVVDLLIRIPS